MKPNSALKSPLASLPASPLTVTLGAAALALTLSACGVRGNLERPAPLLPSITAPETGTETIEEAASPEDTQSESVLGEVPKAAPTTTIMSAPLEAALPAPQASPESADEAETDDTEDKDDQEVETDTP